MATKKPAAETITLPCARKGADLRNLIGEAIPEAGPVLSGVRIVEVESSAHPPEIEAGDLLRVDFEQREIECDGFYALERGNWSGVRRFQHTPGGLFVFEGGEWRQVTAEDRSTMRVTGRVMRVFKGALV